MKRSVKWLTMLALLILSPTLVLAQTQTCAAIIQAAVASTVLECENLAPGQVCYGNAFVEIESDADLEFDRRGARADVNDVQVLRSNPMSLERGEWGMAVLDVSANKPEQTVTYVVVGDVEIENTSETTEQVLLLDARVREVTGANVRALPSEDSELVTRLLSGDVISVTGILEDGTWLRLRLPGDEVGWVWADLMRVEGDRDLIEIAAPNDDAPTNFYSPLQAFDLQSGVFAAICDAAPDSGVLIQSADRSGPINLQINGVTVVFEGTFFVQTDLNNELVFSVLEGAITLNAGEDLLTVEPENRVVLPWDATNESYGLPQEPETYRYLRMRALPLEVLPREVPELEFNLIGIVTPAPPANADPLASLTAESPCTIAPVEEVRLRQGPGNDFPITSRLLARESARPTARSEGADGMLWWRLADDFWVRADVVFWEGNCPELPLIPAPPAPVTE